MSFDVRALTVGPPGHPLIEGLTFEVARGERVALVGPSGIGKSTVLRALCLLDDPLAGALTLDGGSPDEHGVVRWRRRVVLLGQRPVFFGGSVAEELARPSSYASADRPFDATAARARLAELGLERMWEQPAERLSEGEKQRVALVRALSVAPSVLLLDEPTSALDPEAVERVERLLAASDAALVLVTHSARQRERLRARTVDLELLRARERTRAG